jgi:hypothetical protein
MLGCERDIFFTIDNYENTIKYSLSYFSEVFNPSGAPVASRPPWFLVMQTVNASLALQITKTWMNSQGMILNNLVFVSVLISGFFWAY